MLCSMVLDPRPDFDATREDLEGANGIKTAFSGADMSKTKDIAQMIEDARTAFGQIDILINNAGIQHVEAIETFPVSKWNAIIAIDLSAAFHTIRAVVPEMKERGWGRIINIASAHRIGRLARSNPLMSRQSTASWAYQNRQRWSLPSMALRSMRFALGMFYAPCRKADP